MIYHNNSPHRSDLQKQLESTLPEAGELSVGETDPPEELSFRKAQLYSNWVNIYRFLKDVLAFDMNQERQIFYLRSGYQLSFSEDQLGSVAYEAISDTNPEIPEACKSFYPWYYSPHAYITRRKENGVDIGFHYHQRNDHIARYNALVVDIDDGPDRATLEEKFEILDLKPHYLIRTRPTENYFQLVFKLDPIRLGTGNRPQTLKKIDYMLGELAGIFGGDPQAANANQLFRLPFTYRNDLENGCVVRVIEHFDHPRYDLGEVDERIENSAKVDNNTLIRYEYEGAGKGDVLDSPPMRKLQSGTVAYHSRNAALTALSYAYAMDDYTVEEAVMELTEWAENHTAGGYDDHPGGKPQELPESVIHSCYANPKGIDWQRLANIELVDEGRIGGECAKKVLKYMPKTKQIHKRKSPEELENDRYFMSVRKVLETIYNLQRDQQGQAEPVELSNRELAEKADIKYGTLTNRINPVLDELQIKTNRPGKPSKFDLKQAPTPYKPYSFINPGMFKRGVDSVVSLWYRAFPERFGRFCALLDEINRWVSDEGDKLTSSDESGANSSVNFSEQELNPVLKEHIAMVKRHGWDEVRETLEKAGRNPKEIKEAIKEYGPDLEL